MIVRIRETAGRLKGIVTRVYVPQFFISSQQRFGVTDVKAPSACPALRSWIDSVIALRSRMDHVIALRQISVTALFYLEDSRRTHPRSVRACQPNDAKRREWRSAPGHGRERERALWLLFVYVSSSPWARPV